MPGAVGRSILAKFLLWVVPCFLISVGGCLYTLNEYRLRDSLSLLTARIGSHAAGVAGAIGAPTVLETPRLASRILTTLLSDRAVMCAEVRARDGAILAAAPAGLGCRGQDAAEV